MVREVDITPGSDLEADTILLILRDGWTHTDLIPGTTCSRNVAFLLTLLVRQLHPRYRLFPGSGHHHVGHLGRVRHPGASTRRLAFRHRGFRRICMLKETAHISGGVCSWRSIALHGMGSNGP